MSYHAHYTVNIDIDADCEWDVLDEQEMTEAIQQEISAFCADSPSARLVRLRVELDGEED